MTILIILGIIIFLFWFSNLMVVKQPFICDYDREKDLENIFYHFRGKKLIPDYTGICFRRWNTLVFLSIQLKERCITVCNIALIIGKKLK